MSLIVVTIPDDPDLLADWLERQLVGLELHRLITELTAIHGPSRFEPVPLTQVLTGHLERIATSGLSGVPRPLLQYLLTHPSLLLDLQQHILIHGGSYWEQRLSDNPATDAAIDRGWQCLAPISGLVKVPAADPVPRLRWYRQPWSVSLATAAAVLIAVSAWLILRPPTVPQVVAWGWDRPGALPQNVSRSEYLQALADAAGEWFKKRPENAEQLARRLGQFRQGCSTLILREHGPLPEADREWLVERCRNWAGKIDQHLADLEARKDVTAVREASDDTVKKLIKALRERAKIG